MIHRALVIEAIFLFVLVTSNCSDDDPKRNKELPDRVSCTISESLYLSEVAVAFSQEVKDMLPDASELSEESAKYCLEVPYGNLRAEWLCSRFEDHSVQERSCAIGEIVAMCQRRNDTTLNYNSVVNFEILKALCEGDTFGTWVEF